jgi:hypothetical protein
MNGQMAPLSSIDIVELQNHPAESLSLGQLDSAKILAELADVPDEAIAFALAASVFECVRVFERAALCLDEADKIRLNLRALGFDVIAITR